MRTLLCVLANPPVTDGRRTIARVVQLRTLLQYDELVIANLYSTATRDVNGISRSGDSPEPWLDARTALDEAVQMCDGALLAYGVSEPAGEARTLHRQQIDWLNCRLAQGGVRTHTVSPLPRHPSRWQRWTGREHPGVPFVDALAACVVTSEARHT